MLLRCIRIRSLKLDFPLFRRFSNSTDAPRFPFSYITLKKSPILTIQNPVTIVCFDKKITKSIIGVSMPLPNPVIIVPGITATNLRDEYPISPETVWSVLKKDYARISLHPDNPRYEVNEPARIQPDNIMSVAYNELAEELRYNLREKEDKPVPVYPFAYDWRQPLEIIEDQLAHFIKEVIERTKLMRHYVKEGYIENPKVNLVGHSMGGLVLTGYMQSSGINSKVAKVVTLATPFKGSFEAAIKVTTGTANLGTSAPSSRERESARVTPALYHLIPTCSGLRINSEPTSRNLFDHSLWQKSIYQTLEEYVRLYAVNNKNPKQQAEELFNALLDQANEHRNRIESFSLSEAGLTDQDWLVVVGADSTTRIRLQILTTDKGPEFEFRTTDRDNKWKSNNVDERTQTGDGTVPFKGALPSFLNPENLVIVTPDDFGYWEIQDKTLTSIAGFHGMIPNMNMVHRLIVRHFTGRKDSHGNTWGRSVPGITKNNWKPPMELDYKEL